MAGRGAPEQRGHVQPPCCCCCCCCCVGRGGREGGLQPSAVFLLGTLALTSAATALLAAAIMTDRWEQIRFDPEAVKAVARKHNNVSRLNGGEELSSSTPPPISPGAVYHSLTWLFGGLAILVSVTREPNVPPEALALLRTLPSVPDVSVPPVTTVSKVTTEHIDAVTEVGWVSEVVPIDEDEVTSPVSVTSEWTQLLEKTTRVKRKTHGAYMHRKRGDNATYIFLVPMNGGIWTLCIALNEEERNKLREMGFKETFCTNYLSPVAAGRSEEARTDWQHRMQNLSISCALVCLIILGSSALVGAFGVLQHQISAVLVTGVMYLLAATFATFTLTIMHFKRRTKKVDCVVPIVEGGVNVSVVTDSALVDYAATRIFSTGWSLDLGWAGVVFCVMASALWILLSKIMRYSPLSFPTS